jgi:hypothetical protein
MEERDTRVDGTKTPELLVDFITSLDGNGAAEGWPGLVGFTRRGSDGSLCSFELPLLPRLDSGVVMELRKDPSEQAQPWPPAPAVRVAFAREEPRGLLRLREERQDDVPDHEGSQDPSHQPNVSRSIPSVNAGAAPALSCCGR